MPIGWIFFAIVLLAIVAVEPQFPRFVDWSSRFLGNRVRYHWWILRHIHLKPKMGTWTTHQERMDIVREMHPDMPEDDFDQKL